MSDVTLTANCEAPDEYEVSEPEAKLRTNNTND